MTNSSPSPFPISDSRARWLAALGHASFILLGSLGFIIPLLLWSATRRRSDNLTFQLLQALGWQLLFPLYAALALLVCMIGLGITLLITNIPDANPALSQTLGIIGLLILAALLLAYLLPALVGTITCLWGANFHYPWLGKRLESWLAEDIETREDRWAAACSHLCVMLPGVGLVGPLFTWLSQSRRSVWLRFQSAQAVLFQLVWLALVMIQLLALVLAGLSGMVMVLLLSNPDFNPVMQSIVYVFLALGFLAMLAGVLVVLISPFYNTLGLVAAWRVVKRGEYRYPLFARLAEKWLGK